ncbi:hypothetical protein [Yunchengibacter salinarum]|uniref:hypothetical protein n=1 Tax=Yunchengibacter salinarum TaxID=3133399 RepID=UPI0035B57F52
MNISEGGLSAQLQAQNDALRARRGPADNPAARQQARLGAAAFERVAADGRASDALSDSTARPERQSFTQAGEDTGLRRDRSLTVIRNGAGQPRQAEEEQRSSVSDVAETERRVAALNRREAPFGGAIRQAAAGQAGARLGQIVDLTV